jgi:hypothetical protein
MKKIVYQKSRGTVPLKQILSGQKVLERGQVKIKKQQMSTLAIYRKKSIYKCLAWVA